MPARDFGASPLRPARRYPWLSDAWYAGLTDELLVDLAVYGYRQPPGRNVFRLLEEKLQELNGAKTLISYNYYSEDEFWRSGNRDNYFAGKKIPDPKGRRRDLYTKTCRASRGLD